jgi:hypothetical protein
MSVRLGALALVVAATVAVSRDSQAKNPITWVGEKLAAGVTEGAVEKLDPVLARTLADVDRSLTKQELQIGAVAGGLIGKTSSELGVRLDQVDGILEKRILQVQLGVDGVLDHGLDKIDGVARARLAQVDGIVAARIQQVSGDVTKVLGQADTILRERLGDVGQIVTGAIDQADGALGARIEQIDEIAGRRLGNVDVIATKQRLGLERTITRIAWLLALVIFVVVVLRALWTEYLAHEEDLEEAEAGTERAALYVLVFGRTLLRHGLVAGAIAFLLATVPAHLPMAAAQEQDDLVARHASELERSLAALDWTRVRFHASQLELLEPANVARYQALAAKADLLRDLLGKPTALATPAGAQAMLDRAHALERLQGGRPDPDARTVEAMIVWQQGKTRRDEQRSATIAARALWSSPRGFTLRPMARLLVEAYLHAPIPADEDSGSLESAAGMAGVLAAAGPDAGPSPFEGAEALFHLMERLDEVSSGAFVAMVEAQARVSRLGVEPASKAFGQALAERNEQAHRIVTAWEEFDGALRESVALHGNPIILGVFRLDDVPLTHALWFTTQPKTIAPPKRLRELGDAPADKALKLAIAPARAVWARRYGNLLDGPARALVEVQEAQRFQEREEQALAFESAYAAVKDDEAGVAAAPPAKLTKPAKPSKPAEPPSSSLSAIAAALPPAESHRFLAATAAASLGLYQGAGPARTPLATQIAGSLADLQKKAEAALAGEGASLNDSLSKLDADTRRKLHDARVEGVEQLRTQLLGRGTRLI